MIPQRGGGMGHGHPRTTPSYAPVGASYFSSLSQAGGGGHLFKQEAYLKRDAIVLLICGAHRQFFMG